MKTFLKLAALFYLFLLTLALLIPIEFILKRNVATSEPSNETAYLIHLILFFGLYLSFFIAFRNKQLIIILFIPYGVIIEYLQIITHRGFSYEDIFFNLFGLLIGHLTLKIFLYSKIKYFKFLS